MSLGAKLAIALTAVLGLLLLFVVGAYWWAGLSPKRPRGTSDHAIYVEPDSVPFTVLKTGVWVDCWFDAKGNVDLCKMTDLNGDTRLEGVFMPYEGLLPVPQSELKFDVRRTGTLWLGDSNGTSYPVVYLMNGEILIPESDYDHAKQEVDWSKGERPEP